MDRTSTFAGILVTMIADNTSYYCLLHLSQTAVKTYCLTTPSIAKITWYRWCINEGIWSIDGMTVTGEIRCTRKTTCPIISLSTTDPTCPGLESNFSLYGDSQATYYLIHGTTPPRYWLQCCKAFVSRGHESNWLLSCTYFFGSACSNAIYFRTLTIAQDVWTGLSRRMTRWLVNNGLEVCGKSRPYYNLRHFPSIYMDRLKKTTNKSVQLYKIRNRQLLNTSKKHHIWVMYVGFCRHKFRWLATGSVASMSDRNSGYE
jgi:hypothetical protein